VANELSAAVFIDRDGTIIEDADYCSHPKQVKVLPGVPEALQSLKSRGFKLIVITNQSGIGRGFFTVDEYRSVESEVARQLGHSLIDATYFCPDIPGLHSSCRKPSAAMVLQAKREHQIDLGRSFFIGDKEIDAECGRHAGVRTIRVQTGFQRDTTGSIADWVAPNLVDASKIIVDLVNE